MKKIAIDVSGLSWGPKTGVQNLYHSYILAYLDLMELYPDIEFIFYDKSGIYNLELGGLDINYLSNSLFKKSYKYKYFFKSVNKFIISKNLNISGAINHVWNWDIYEGKNNKQSILIHDTLPLDFPLWFSKKMKGLTLKSLIFAEKKANFIFANSFYTKSKIIETTNIAEERISVVYPGINPMYFESADNAFDVESILPSYKLDSKKYFISSGYIDPRKNLVKQIEAFEIFAASTGSDFKLAITGSLTSMSEEVIGLISKPSLRAKVKFLGYVPDRHLIELMKKSAGLLFCSLSEGFGLPIVEAYALGVPVITSNVTSMKEISAGNAILVDPESVEDIAAAIYSLVNRAPEEASYCYENGKKIASVFTVNNWLKGHLDVWNS